MEIVMKIAAQVLVLILAVVVGSTITHWYVSRQPTPEWPYTTDPRLRLQYLEGYHDGIEYVTSNPSAVGGLGTMCFGSGTLEEEVYLDGFHRSCFAIGDAVNAVNSWSKKQNQ